MPHMNLIVLSQYSWWVIKLRASFKLNAEIDGTYVLTIIKIIKSGYSFDPDNSNVLNGIIDIKP